MNSMTEDRSSLVFCAYNHLAKPDSLKPHPDNPHKHQAEHVEILAALIRRIGWRHPIVISMFSGLIIAGHLRQTVARALGCKVPVDVQVFTPEEELELLLVDNKIPELATYDTEKVRQLETEIRAFGGLEYFPEEVPATEPPPPLESGEGTPTRGDGELTRFSCFVSDVARQAVFEGMLSLQREVGEAAFHWKV